MIDLTSFGEELNVAVVGSNGGIGSAIVKALTASQKVEVIFELGRTKPEKIGNKSVLISADMLDESSVIAAASAIKAPLDMVIVATGLLHDDDTGPEKTWRQFSVSDAEKIFRVNAFGPMLIAKHFLAKLNSEQKSVFAALSAKVGSISDNELGGWYTYRASKAALNQYIKCSAIELGRKNKNAICVGLHPGTVATDLSAPFQANVQPGKLFDQNKAATQLLSVLNDLEFPNSGNLISWDGSTITP
ncbi:MAG: SDR family NAD(P)-dependent oxidoreductase [Hyphomicrobiales bacterium]